MTIEREVTPMSQMDNPSVYATEFMNMVTAKEIFASEPCFVAIICIVKGNLVQKLEGILLLLLEIIFLEM